MTTWKAFSIDTLVEDNNKDLLKIEKIVFATELLSINLYLKERYQLKINGIFSNEREYDVTKAERNTEYIVEEGELLEFQSDVLTVSKDGLIVANKAGTVTITVINDGKIDSIVVNVLDSRLDCEDDY
jgi:hypothetical protein